MTLLLFLHWVGDFVLQSDYMAKNKSKNIMVLFIHCLIYTAVFAFQVKFQGLLILFVSHFIIDFCSSKINAKLYKAGEIHWFFTSIGFDQFLHLSILYYIFSH